MTKEQAYKLVLDKYHAKIEAEYGCMEVDHQFKGLSRQVESLIELMLEYTELGHNNIQPR